MMATTLRHLDQLLHTVERGRPLNVDESGRLPVRLYGPDGQPLFTEQNPAHVKGEVTLTGSRVAEQLTHQNAVNNVLTFSAPVEVVEIYHEESSWQTFIVNGLTLTVPPGGYRTPVGGTPSMQVTIPAGVACIVGRLV